MTEVKQEIKALPKHVAIIPDGNRRWARTHNLPQFEGHRKGFDAVNAVIRKANELGIHTMTLWGFSTENWSRSEEEVSYLMGIFENSIDTNLKEAEKNNTRVVHLGRKDRLPKSLVDKIVNAEAKTLNNTSHVLNIALDYGGHDELNRAIYKFTEDVLEKKVLPTDVNKITGKLNGKYPYYFLKDYLDTKNQPYPYPDLIIRTSGEQRLSGFLSWQMAYAELYFTSLHMPDFSPERFEEAVSFYTGRERRFGGNLA